MGDDLEKPATLRDISVLENHVGQRLRGIERLLEKTTLAIDKIAENRTRTLVVEAQLHALAVQLSALQEDTKAAGTERVNIRLDVVKLMTFGSIGTAILAIVIPIAITFFMNGVFNP